MVQSHIPTPSRKSAAETPADLLMFAALGDVHSIEERKVTIEFDRSKPGHNALNQLTRRLEAALPHAVAMMAPPSADPRPGRVALALARKAANGMREGAAHDGHYSDGGAGHLEALCDAFECGVQLNVPEFLKPYMAQAEREADPEYAQYQRLHAKFGGKA